jgi:peptide/nickel transport system permease protein
MTSTSRSPFQQRLQTLGDRLTGFVTSDMFVYTVKRLLQAIPTLLLASMLCFAIIQLAPGDYLDTYMENPQISRETIEQFRQQFGLDRSPVEQYWLWLQRVVTKGDFGISFAYQRPVSSLLWERVGATLLLSIASLILTWSIAIPLGIVGAVHQNQLSGSGISHPDYRSTIPLPGPNVAYFSNWRHD